MDRLAIDAMAAVDAGYPKDAKRADRRIGRTGEQVQSRRSNQPHIETQALSRFVAKDTAARLKIWKGRKSAFCGQAQPDFIVQMV